MKQILLIAALLPGLCLGQSGWDRATYQDPITDEVTHGIRKTPQGRPGLFDRETSLGILCDNGEMQIVVNWNLAFQPGRVSITHRVDQGEPIESDWLAADSISLYPGDPAQFAKVLIAANTLAIRATSNSNQETATMVFDLSGLAAAIAHLQNCPL